MKKKLYATGVAHPAVYSEPLLPMFADALSGYPLILDPFAGVGRIHELRNMIDCGTVGVEIEKEWADLHPDTVWGNSLFLDEMFPRHAFDAICTSPTYGNRMADHHNASDGSLRRSYKHDLGHDLHPDNTGQMYWGDDYRGFHSIVWTDCVDLMLKPGGRFVLNCKDHIKRGERQRVCAWHVETLENLGLELTYEEEAPTRGNRHGENRHLRCPEMVYIFDKPDA